MDRNNELQQIPTPRAALRIAAVGIPTALAAGAAVSFQGLAGLGMLVGIRDPWLLPIAIDVYAATSALITLFLPEGHRARNTALWNARLGLVMSMSGNAAFRAMHLDATGYTTSDGILTFVGAWPSLIVERLLHLQGRLTVVPEPRNLEPGSHGSSHTVAGSSPDAGNRTAGTAQPPQGTPVATLASLGIGVPEPAPGTPVQEPGNRIENRAAAPKLEPGTPVPEPAVGAPSEPGTAGTPEPGNGSSPKVPKQPAPRRNPAAGTVTALVPKDEQLRIVRELGPTITLAVIQERLGCSKTHASRLRTQIADEANADNDADLDEEPDRGHTA